jgi:hypothetical protein
MTHKRTPTDVIVTEYPATFGLSRGTGATIDFGRVKQWNLGPWQYRERLTRRRRWTVKRDYLVESPGYTSEDYTDALRRSHPGLFRDSIDADKSPVAVLVRSGSAAAVVFIEQVRRSGE